MYRRLKRSLTKRSKAEVAGLPWTMSVGPMALVLLLALGAPAEEEKPMLGEFVHARGAVHSMSRADLQSELSTRQVISSDGFDLIKVRKPSISSILMS